MEQETRKARTESILINESAKFLNDKLPIGTLVTITQCKFRPKNNTATIYLSVFPTDKKLLVLKEAKKLRSALYTNLIQKTKIGQVPKIDIDLDYDYENQLERGKN